MQSLQRRGLHALVGEQPLEGVPGVGETVEVEGVLGQAELHVVLSRRPAFALIQHLGLLVRTEAVQPLKRGGEIDKKERVFTVCFAKPLHHSFHIRQDKTILVLIHVYIIGEVTSI